MTAARVKSRAELRRERRRRAHGCWDHLLIAPLWPKHGVNLGTLLRTCDAVGACMVVPRRPWIPDALAHGNTLRKPQCVHWIQGRPERWLERQRTNSAIVGVELTDESIRLADLPTAQRRTIIVLGHETTGIPPEGLELLDVAVEIPMIGTGHSLNVAVAGSLVLYKLAGLC
ncbi:RNA methyltransferase [Nocardia altamirensis]|uniref:RNA methyltransferase n=1 Tax=Nocardia altamirensis TaxID=472158 RepID=UPI00114CFE99|nr:RNA methyltransferase [Nocardia altamirensis]